MGNNRIAPTDRSLIIIGKIYQTVHVITFKITLQQFKTVRLTQNQQSTRATNLCWRIAFCKAYRLPSSYPSFPLFWALPSVDKNQNIPTLLTCRFQDNDRSPTRPFQPPCWTRQQHVSEAGLREDLWE